MTAEDRMGWTPGGAAGPVPPGLHFVATPIGAARDITLRALDILAGADVLAAEDTRTLRHLMDIHGIRLGDRPLVAYHDHNGEAARPGLLRALEAGRSVAYASEAGTPLVADPGFQLARAVLAAGLKVHAAPGPSAVLCALTVSGLPTDRFLFAGFPPAAAGARRSFLEEVSAVAATLVLYESPRRIARLLQELAAIAGPSRPAVVCRELTKRFEEVSRGTLGTLAEAFAAREVKGEIVLLLDRPAASEADAEEIGAMLRRALKTMSVKDAAAAVAERTGGHKRSIYQMALSLTKERDGE